jgi:hypothetical protein
MNRLSELLLTIALPLVLLSPFADANPDHERLLLMRAQIAQAKASIATADTAQLQHLAQTVERLGQALEEHWAELWQRDSTYSMVKFLNIETLELQHQAMTLIANRLSQISREHLNNAGVNDAVGRALKIWHITYKKINTYKAKPDPALLHTLSLELDAFHNALAKAIRLIRQARLVEEERLSTFEEERAMLMANLMNYERIIQAIEDLLAPPVSPSLSAAAAAAADQPSPTPVAERSAEPTRSSPPLPLPPPPSPSLPDNEILLEGLNSIVSVLAIVFLGYGL